jgi:pimeloyl-ACP methyl ester carboxylesterase
MNQVKFDRGKLIPNDESHRLFKAYNLAPDVHASHEPNLEIYGKTPEFKDGTYTSDLYGVASPKDLKEGNKSPLKIAYTTAGNKGPVVIFLHGVPTNRRMKFPLMKRMSKFCRCVAFDMLGMGESSMPINFPWSWEIHATYVPGLVEEILSTRFGLSKDTKVFFQADDWGAGILAKVSEKPWAREHLHSSMYLDPISFSGYFIAEIGAIGRASQIPWPDKSGQFEMAMGSLDQSLVQIEKSMVRDSKVTNQWQQRDDLHAYVETDYERNRSNENVIQDDEKWLEDLMRIDTPYVYTPLTRKLKFWNIRVLSQQSAMLRPASLQPYSHINNPQGIQYNLVEHPVLVCWGKQDNMMPAGQIYHFKYAHPNAAVQLVEVPDAGHFAEKDQPDFIATTYLNYIEQILGLGVLAQPFLGFDGIWKGDEEERSKLLSNIYPYKN